MRLTRCHLSAAITMAIFAIAIAFAPESKAACDNCGTVVDTKTVKKEGEGTGVGAVAGGVLGGVLGHQIGGGRGQDIATGVGAVGGAVVGANVGRNYGSGPQYSTQNVQRCENVPNGRPAYWDVTYNFRGQYHRVQLTAPPGPTVLVNSRGEPRV